MKKGISILLCVAMLMSLFAGVGLKAAAANLKGIGFSAVSDIICYEGCNTWQDFDFFNNQQNWYTRYNVGPRELEEEGNALTLYYDDDTSDTYTYQKVYRSENPDDYDLRYVNASGEEFDIYQVGVDTRISYENQWSVGNRYMVYLEYNGFRASTYVQLRENPVASVNVYYDRPLQLMENTCGRWEHDDESNTDWFNYWFNSRYNNKANIALDVEYTNGDSKHFSFHEEENWTLTTDDGEFIDERFFNVDLRQWDTHYSTEGSNEAFVSYYGKGSNVPVEVIPAGTVNEGTLEPDQRTYVLTYSSEWHDFTIAPQTDGAYRIEDSVRDRCIYDNKFECRMFCGEEEIVSQSNEDLVYLLEANKVYTFRCRCLEEDVVWYEPMVLRQATCITKLEFNPVEPISVYAGDSFDNDLLYREGNRFTATFSNGVEQEFVCDDNNNYNVDGGWRSFEDFAREQGMEDVQRLYGIPSSEPWSAEGEQSVEIVAGNGRTFVPVTVLASPYKAITFSPAKALELYEGTAREDWGENAQGEWVPYQRYEINKWNLEEIDNSLTVTYPDDSTKTFNCEDREVQVGDHTEWRLCFVAPDEEIIWVSEFITSDDQGPDNEWTAGNSYTLTLCFRGQKTEIPVSVTQNPIKEISVNIPDGKLTLFENHNGFEEYNDMYGRNYFKYHEDKNYLRAERAEITLTWADESTTTYRYRDYNWMPEDDEGDELQDRYFNFDFGDQWQQPLDSLDEPLAYISYFGKTTTVPVEVVPLHDVDEGSIAVDELKAFFFLGSEAHSVTFTPETSGAYRFEEGLTWSTLNNEGYTYSVSDGENELENIATNRNMIFLMEAGKSYTISFRYDVENYGDSQRLEYFRIVPTVVVTDFDFTAADGNILVHEGEFGGDRDIRKPGNSFSMTFSNGVRDTFTCNNEGRFENAEGRELNDFGYSIGMDEDAFPEITASVPTWEKEGEQSLLMRSGKVQKEYPVTVAVSEVESLVYTQAKPLEILDYEMEYRDWENHTEFWGNPFRRGDTVTITYLDERGSVTYALADGNRFVNVEDNRDELWLDFAFDDSRRYELGDTIAFLVYFQTGQATIEGTLTQSDVESISFTPASITRYIETDGRWEKNVYFNDETGEEFVDEYFFYNDGGECLLAEGNSLTVNYNDGRVEVFTCDGQGFFNEKGEELDYYYIGTYSDQRFNHWVEDGANPLYITYKGAECYVQVRLVERPAWEPWAVAVVEGKGFADGDTLYIEPGRDVFVTFDTDDRNMLHNVAPFVGFSDGYEGGTLSTAGFAVETGTREQLGYGEGDEYGMKLGSGALTVGSKGELYLFLFEADENTDFENFDFVNTPHALDVCIHVEVSDHRWQPQVIEPTCTDQGYTLYTCAICGDSYQADFTEALGHDYSRKAVSADTQRTAKEEGHKATFYYSCSRCDAVDRTYEHFFEDPRCSIVGKLQSAFYRTVAVTLYKGDVPIAEQNLLPEGDGSFCFSDLEEGVYALEIGGGGLAGMAITQIHLHEGTELKLADSDNAAVSALCVPVGDMNDDNTVDMADISVLLSAQNFGLSQFADTLSDINNDGVVDIVDVGILLNENNFGKSAAITNF